MNINLKVIKKALSTAGFELSYNDNECGNIVFARRHSESLFERIRIDFGTPQDGRLGDVAGADIDCVIVPGRTALKGLGETRCLIEVATDERGWADVRNPSDAALWQAKLIDIAPRAARTFAMEVGQRLLADTAVAREAAWRYYKLAGNDSTVADRLSRLKKYANQPQLKESERVVAEPICMIPGGHKIYELAALSIAMFCGDVEGDPSWLRSRSTMTEVDRALMIRLQIIASLLNDPIWHLL